MIEDTCKGAWSLGTACGKCSKCCSQLQDRIAELERLVVTNVLLKVAPGEDGMGTEIYAKSVDDVTGLLTTLSEKIESLEAALAKAQAAKIPMTAISNILNEVMEIAVKNGANSISMPDDYVAVAHFVSYPEQYGGVPNRDEVLEQVTPADPMDWPLPCDVKVGAGTTKKGVALRTLVKRMEVMHRIALDEPVIPITSDAARFVWWFGDSDKGNFINQYMHGVYKSFDINQWREVIDDAIAASKAA